MLPSAETGRDVMQICRNGHVITDRLRTDPQTGRSHCDRCGVLTIDHCLTCGHELSGAAYTFGLVPIGNCSPPRYCSACGAAFPWTRRPSQVPRPLALLEDLLKRLPLVIRQLRWRQGDRPPFRVEDERDLEDLLRAVLLAHFDDVRLESRTPRYSPGTRTDLLLAPEGMALTVKHLRSAVGERQIVEQLREDVAYYRYRGGCRTLVCFIYDPEGLLRDRQMLEGACSELSDNLGVRCVIAGLHDGKVCSL